MNALKCWMMVNWGSVSHGIPNEFLCLTAHGQAFLAHCTLVSLLPRVCSRSLVLFRHLFYLPSHGNSWPCFCAGSRAFNYCKTSNYCSYADLILLENKKDISFESCNFFSVIIKDNWPKCIIYWYLQQVFAYRHCVKHCVITWNKASEKSTIHECCIDGYDQL